MKKVLLFVAVVTAASFASCKKDRVCTCTSTTTPGGGASTTSVVTYTEAKKGDARAACLSSTQTDVFGGTSYTTTRDCSLN
jgi:hypothetical protein